MQANCRAETKKLEARFKKELEEHAFKMYVTQAVKNINKILAETYSGTYMQVSFDEVLNPKPKDERTAEEIIHDIKTGLERLN